MLEEAAFPRADGRSERLGELKPSAGRRLNYVIIEHKEAIKKLRGQLKILSDHDSTLFQVNIWHYPKVRQEISSRLQCRAHR